VSAVESVPHGWRHVICRTCYAERQPGREPVALKPEFCEDERCCFCGEPTREGVYLRAPPEEPAFCEGRALYRDREQHLAWCKERAIRYLEPDRGSVAEAAASFMSDLSKHPGTRQHPALVEVGDLLVDGADGETIRRFIEGVKVETGEPMGKAEKKVEPKPKLDLTRREDVVQFVTSLQKWLRRDFQRDGEIRPAAIVFITDDSDIGKPLGEVRTLHVVLMQLTCAQEKDAYSQFVGEIAQRGRAIGVLMVLEFWVVRGATREDAKRAGWKSLEDAPGRTECVHMSLEHLALEPGSHIWMADIERSETVSRGKLGEFVYAKPTHTDGRFSHLLDRERFQ